MKRIITISLLLFVLIAFTFSSFCSEPYEPPNNIDATWRYELIFTYSFTYVSPTYPFGDSVHGIFHFLYPDTVSDGSFGSSLDFFIDFSSRVVDTLYVCFPVAYGSDFEDNGTLVPSVFGSLSDFYDSSSDLEFTVPRDWLPVYEVSKYPPYVEIDTSSLRTTIDVHAFCFKNVTPDAYSLYYSVPVDSSFYSRGSIFYFGVFGMKDTNFAHIDDIMSSYSSGDISFSDAVSGLVRTAQSVSPTDGIASLIEIEKLSLSLEELKADQYSTSISSAMDSFGADASSVLGGFFNNSLTYSAALGSLLSLYSDYLAAASSVEEAQLLTGQYNLLVDYLSVQASYKTRSELDSVITDDDFDFTDDYYEMEDQILAEFDQAQFESLLAYNDWLSSMDVQEASLYREFFNFFLEDSELKNFIVVPMVLSLVSILLGTSLRYAKGHSGSGKGSGKS